MFVQFVLYKSEFEPSEYSAEAVFVFSEEIWGEQVVVYDRVVAVHHGRHTTVTFPDGAQITDPSWVEWGVVEEIPHDAHARGEANEHAREQ